MLAGRDSPPSWSHPFGTTREGYDVFSQVLTAAPLTLELIGGATAIALVLAVALRLRRGGLPGPRRHGPQRRHRHLPRDPDLPLAIVVAGVLPAGTAHGGRDDADDRARQLGGGGAGAARAGALRCAARTSSRGAW